jgi:small subunit ribosomal protein S6
MPLYESVFIVRQDVTAAQVDTLADGFAKIVDDNGGSIQRREYWGLRGLAFRIKKNRKGHYVLFNVDAPSDAVQEMERNMRLNEDVLRYMTVRVDTLREEPSPIMQGKGDRERERADRTGRGGRGRSDRPPRPSDDDTPKEASSDKDTSDKDTSDKATSDTETKSED